MKELQNLDENYTIALNAEQTARKEMEQKMIRLFEDKLTMLRNDISNEIRMRE